LVVEQFAQSKLQVEEHIANFGSKQVIERIKQIKLVIEHIKQIKLVIEHIKQIELVVKHIRQFELIVLKLGDVLLVFQLLNIQLFQQLSQLECIQYICLGKLEECIQFGILQRSSL